MSARWVAATVRARAMARRRIGSAAARRLAASGSLGDALTVLAATPYGHVVRPDQTLAEAEHAVGATLLWNLRVLAGWLPRDAGDMLRVLAGWFEAANVDEQLRAMAGRAADPPYRLGTLATAWHRLAHAASPGEVRTVLATSPWGDPGGETPRFVHLGMRLAWAQRVVARVAPAAPWAYGGAALVVAREAYVAGHPLPEPAATMASRLLGPAVADATSVRDLHDRLPRDARWALAGMDSPDTLWQAEGRWWSRVEADAFALLRRPRFSPEPVIGAVAALAVDAWRVGAALEGAARGGAAREVFDAVA